MAKVCHLKNIVYQIGFGFNLRFRQRQIKLHKMGWLTIAFDVIAGATIKNIKKREFVGRNAENSDVCYKSPFLRCMVNGSLRLRQLKTYGERAFS